MCVFVCVFICLCVRACVRAWLAVYKVCCVKESQVPICLWLYVCLCLWLYVCLCLWLYVCLCLYVLCLSMCLSGKGHAPDAGDAWGRGAGRRRSQTRSWGSQRR